ncbi:MAG: DUF3800 domain-containing protein [Anaerolineae bacterium]|nr:DUF3800 domain-containing protein [Anaerolineae bacterium]
MYLLYLDDSGSPGNPNEDYFVLGGICISEASVRWLSHRLDQIACVYGEQVELHYEDLAARFNNHLEQNVSTERHQERGLIILDKSSYETGLQSLTINLSYADNPQRER